MGECSEFHHNGPSSGPPAKRHLNGVSLACRCWPKIECRLGSFVAFQGILTTIAMKPYIFMIFSGGPVLPSGCMIFIKDKC